MNVGFTSKGSVESACRVRFFSAIRAAARARRPWLILIAVIVLGGVIYAEGSAHVNSIEPAAGKVNDSATVTGENLQKGSVAAVYLSDDKADYKATLVEQTASKINIKIPQVKPGDYNVSIQVGNNIFIQPVRFKVQE